MCTGRFYDLGIWFQEKKGTPGLTPTLDVWLGQLWRTSIDPEPRKHLREEDAGQGPQDWAPDSGLRATPKAGDQEPGDTSRELWEVPRTARVRHVKEALRVHKEQNPSSDLCWGFNNASQLNNQHIGALYILQMCAGSWGCGRIC